jgi:DNA invertase Pin-like site-specific DNA recombinase
MDKFCEVETGKGEDAVERRPQLKAALAACKRQKATPVIAKLDRLARNTHFITGLRKSKLDFVACDYPLADKMQIQLLAVFAEHKRDMIAKRTSERLQAMKTSGQRPPPPRLISNAARSFYLQPRMACGRWPMSAR